MKFSVSCFSMEKEKSIGSGCRSSGCSSMRERGVGGDIRLGYLQ